MQVSTQFPLWRFLSVTLWNHRQASDIIKHSSFGLHVGTKSQSRAEALRRTADKRGHFLTFSWYVTFSKYLRSPPVLNRQNRTKLKNYSLILNILRQKKQNTVWPGVSVSIFSNSCTIFVCQLPWRFSYAHTQTQARMNSATAHDALGNQKVTRC